MEVVREDYCRIDGLRDLRRDAEARIFVEAQDPQTGEFSERGGQRLETIALQPQTFEPIQFTEPLGQPVQLIASEGKVFQMPETAKPIRHLLQAGFLHKERA